MATRCSSTSRSTWRARAGRALAATLLVAGTLAAVDAPSRGDVVVVVAASSPVEALAQSELADLFLGRATRFPDGRPAVPIDQREASAARAEFYTAYLGRSLVQIKAHWSKVIFTGRGSPPRALADSDQVRRLVAADPNTVGYLERSRVDASLKIVRIE